MRYELGEELGLEGLRAMDDSEADAGRVFLQEEFRNLWLARARRRAPWRLASSADADEMDADVAA